MLLFSILTSLSLSQVIHPPPPLVNVVLVIIITIIVSEL